MQHNRPPGVSIGHAGRRGRHRCRCRLTPSVVAAMEDFEDFVRAHLPSLLRTAFLLTGGDGPAAEDAVQETLTRLYPRWTQGATRPTIHSPTCGAA